jgi:carbamoyltransferase
MDIIPTRAIRYCLKNESINLNDISLITIGWNHNKYPDFMKNFFERRMSHPNKDSYSNFVESLALFNKSPDVLIKRIKIAFKRSGINGELPKVEFKNHHESHVASVFFPSMQESALTFVIDGSGEEMATSIWKCKRNKLPELIDIFELPDSLGYFYGAITEFLGFSIFTGEGKVMGMAPYGKPNKFIRNKLKEFLFLDDQKKYFLDPKYIYFGPRNTSFKHTDLLSNLLNEQPRVPESKIDQIYLDIAYETQSLLEKTVSSIVLKYIKKTGINNVCISGGVANNCKMNGLISSLPEVDNCFVLPTSADNGVSFGSAILHVAQVDPKSKVLNKTFTPYLGPSFSSVTILETLKEAKITKFKKYSDTGKLCKDIAKFIAEGKIIGWFQGRLEVGARALGNRSILANPAFPEMKDKINRDVKRREYFRPFAPSILEKFSNVWFDFDTQSNYKFIHKYMLQASQARTIAKEKTPAIVHTDNSVRPQIVSLKDNSLYHKLLSEFYKITKVPILLNTSFNVRGEPIVCRPDEALRCFISHGLDILVMENIVLTKEDF